jgi:NurA-like 5'-3' nuclease
MINDVYRLLVERKQELVRKVALTQTDWAKKFEEVSSKEWVNFCPDPDPRLSVTAIDGGMWLTETRAGAVFAVDAAAVSGKGIDWNLSDSMAEVGFLSPGNDAREMVSLFMEILELKLALRSLDKTDLVLMDGSVRKKSERSQGVLQTLDALDLSGLEALKGKDEREIYEIALSEHRKSLIELLARREKVLWVSKKSRSTEIFNSGYPDQTILEIVTEECGYTRPRKIELKFLPSPMYYSFVRLRKGAHVLRVDFSGDENALRGFIAVLRSVEVTGYPVQLLQAHKLARFSKSDRKKLMTTLSVLPRRKTEWIPRSFK